MKKKLITICITLILFCSSLVPVFAEAGFEYVPFWLHDFYTQSVNYGNNGSNYFGTWTATDSNGYESNLLAYGLMQDIGGAATFYYTVSPGDTVYFRLAVQKNALGGRGYISTDLYIDGTLSSTTNYSVVNDGFSGSQAFIFINQDYTNNSSTKKTIRYMISNTNSSNDIIYFPIACGTTDMIIGDNIALDISSFPTFDTSDLEGILDELIKANELLSDISLEVPNELWKTYKFFEINYNYYPSDEQWWNIPFMITDNYQGNYDTGFNSSRMFYCRNYGRLYFSYVISAASANIGAPVLYFSDGTSYSCTNYGTLANNDILEYNVVTVFWDLTEIPRNGYVSISLPDNRYWHKILPLYIGDGSNITENLSYMTGLPTVDHNDNLTIIDKLSQLINIFSNSDNTVINNATNTNNQLSQSVNQYDNIEQQQVQDFTNNIANLPSFDFGSISDFNTTANFVSTQMQNIYNSSDYIKFMFTAVLTFGIALVLIGRGLRR